MTEQNNETTAVAVYSDKNDAKIEKLTKLTMGCHSWFGCSNKEEAEIMAYTMWSENLTPMQYMKTYDIVQGKPRMRSDAMLAKFASHGGTYKVLKRTAEECVVEFTWRESTNEMEYTMEDAKLAGLVKSGGAYEKHPKNMLFARCISNGLRTYVPELFAGHYTAEEMSDDAPTPPPVQPVKPLFAETVKEENDLSKPIEERMDVEVLPPEGKEIKHTRATPKNEVQDVEPIADDEVSPAENVDEDKQQAITDQNTVKFGWAECLVLTGIDLYDALTWLGDRGWVSENVYEDITERSQKKTVAKAINTLSQEHKDKIKNNIDGFKKAVNDLKNELKGAE